MPKAKQISAWVEDRPGAGVNIEYAYVGTAGSARSVNLHLAVSDMKRALAALR